MTPATKELRQLYWMNMFRRYPSFPIEYFPPPKYTDRTANGLTKMITDYIRFSSGQAERISVTGRRIDETQTVKDCLGRRRRIGCVKWIRSSMQPGTADISATYRGLSLKIEVKIGRDKQSEVQKRYQDQIETAGGRYFIAHNFEEFYNWFETIKKEHPGKDAQNTLING